MAQPGRCDVFHGTILSTNPAADRIEARGEDEMVGKNSDDPQWSAVRADGTPFPGQDHPAMYTLRTGEPQHDVVMGIITSPDTTILCVNKAFT